MNFTSLFLILLIFKPAYVHAKEMPSDGLWGDRASCEEDWDQFGEHCYKLEGVTSGIGLSRSGASARCSELGGHLASIHSKEENEFLKNSYAISSEQYIWIGLQSIGDLSSYQWDDGSPTVFQNWALNEPQPVRESPIYCTVVIDDFLFGYPGEWIDWICGHYQPYICKKNVRKVNDHEEEPVTAIQIEDKFSTFRKVHVHEEEPVTAIQVEDKFSTDSMKGTTPGNQQEITSSINSTQKGHDSGREPTATIHFEDELSTSRKINAALQSVCLNMLLLLILY